MDIQIDYVFSFDTENNKEKIYVFTTQKNNAFDDYNISELLEMFGL